MSITIKEIRQKLYLSQTGLAKELGVCRQMVWRYEAGKVRPSFDVVKKLIVLCRENGLEITMDDLLIDIE